MTDRASPRSPPAYDLRIDELLLDGFSAADQRSLVAAMRRELTRILSDPGAPAFRDASGHNQNLAVADAGVVSIAPGASPQKIGLEAARSIGRCLGALNSGQSGPLSGGSRR
jgi:hypothetical protein